MKKYVIGITPRFSKTEDNEFIRVSLQYTTKLTDSKLIPLILVPSFNFEDELALCDGYLIIGGNDISPEYYNETNDEGLSNGVNIQLDEIDKRVLSDAIKHNKPILGICRGLQAFAAFLNGSLFQDIEYANKSHPLLEEHYHNVTKVNDYGIAKLLPNEFYVNSFHHQAINKLPDTFIPLFKNGDIIEAIESTVYPFVGFQWHPERYYTKESEIIFNYFVTLLDNN